MAHQVNVQLAPTASPEDGRAELRAIPGVLGVTQVFPDEADDELRRMFVVEVDANVARQVVNALQRLALVDEAELVTPRRARAPVGEVIEVVIADLIPYEPAYIRSAVPKRGEADARDDDGPIKVAKLDHRYVVTDGTHRTIAALRAGEMTIRATVIPRSDAPQDLASVVALRERHGVTFATLPGVASSDARERLIRAEHEQLTDLFADLLDPTRNA